MTGVLVRRSAALDGLRGAAVVLMVADHLAATAGMDLLRLGPTRWALPIFALIAGSLTASTARLVECAAAGLVVSALAIGSDWMNGVDVLVLLVGAKAVVQLRPGWALPAAVVGLCQAAYVPVEWSGYQPGWVLGWVALGALVPVRAWAEGLPSLTRLAGVGRWPLAIYVGHLVLLRGMEVL